MNEHNAKITPEHLKRPAFVYIRQSTLQQVIDNTESTRRQYELRRRAVSLGWPESAITVIDCDLGQSGSSSSGRAGFQRLVGEVGMGQVGIVMGLEVSRLARNCADWHRLLELCVLGNTLILDEDGVYDPRLFNDRLLLGLKGTMSEAESHMLRARMQGGYWARARRGELKLRLPVGLVYDDADRVQLDPDQSIRDAFGLLFTTFARQGTVGATVRHFHEHQLKLPRRPPHGKHKGEIIWTAPDHDQVIRALHNPRYAGAYAVGRTTQRVGPDGRRRTKRLEQSRWKVLLPDAHDGYITWEQFEHNQRTLHANHWRFRGQGGTTPPREGSALLQGVVICGICGKRMTISYYQRQGKRAPRYSCPRPSVPTAGNRCQQIPGLSIDEAVGQLLVEVVTPLSLEVALQVQQEIERRVDETNRVRLQHVERARHEAEAARRRYMRVDPDNRLVADTLEADWNSKLRALAAAQQEYERRRQGDAAILSSEQRDRITSLATDFTQVWRAPNTSHRDRKRILRLLVEDVTLVKEAEAIAVHVRFRGGSTRTLSLPRPQPSWKNWLTPQETVHEIDRLLDEMTDGEIADNLNERGFRSGRGGPFSGINVGAIRRTYGLRSRFERLRERGWLTFDEVASKAGVSRRTVHKWRRQGKLTVARCNDNGQYVCDPHQRIPKKNEPPHRRKDRSDRTAEPNPKRTTSDKEV